MYLYTEHLGYAPVDVIRRSKIWQKFFAINSTGITFLHKEGQLPCQPNSKTLEGILNENEDPELIDLLKKCLAMDPKKRSSANELLQHPWLTSENQRPVIAAEYIK